MSLEFFQKQKQLIEESLTILDIDYKTFKPYQKFVSNFRINFIKNAIEKGNYILNGKLPSVEVWSGEERLFVLKTVDKNEYLFAQSLILEKEGK